VEKALKMMIRLNCYCAILCNGSIEIDRIDSYCRKRAFELEKAEEALWEKSFTLHWLYWFDDTQQINWI